MGNDNILIVVVLAVVAYFVLTSKTWIDTAKAAAKGISAITDDPCSGYAFSPPLYIICRALNPQPAKAVDGSPVQAPQTPAPTPTKCPWDASMLLGDRRCGTQKIEYPTAPTDPGCVSGEYYLDVPTGVFQRCP